MGLTICLWRATNTTLLLYHCSKGLKQEHYMFYSLMWDMNQGKEDQVVRNKTGLEIKSLDWPHSKASLPCLTRQWRLKKWVHAQIEVLCLQMAFPVASSGSQSRGRLRPSGMENNTDANTWAVMSSVKWGEREEGSSVSPFSNSCLYAFQPGLSTTSPVQANSVCPYANITMHRHTHLTCIQ